MTPSVPTVLTARAPFEAARHIDTLPAGHRARRLHGHSFVASVRCAVPAGWAPFPGGEVQRLQGDLQACVAQLDYGLLNDHLQQPTDEVLARWLQQALGVPGLQKVGIQSTAHQGVDLDASGAAHLWRRHAFESAHRLPHVAPGHPCGRMHGHGFEAVVHVRAPAGGANAGSGHDAIDAAWAPLHQQLDHTCLNDLPGLDNPTSERLSGWLWTRLKPALPGLSSVTVRETGSSGAHFDGSRYRIWKEMTLDSAVQLRQAPDGSPQRRMHGHTYTLRLHLSAPLDPTLGWTVDFGDVKAAFAPIFAMLDHQPLHEIADLPDCDTQSLARWVLDKARARLPALDRVDVFQTRGCGAIVWTHDGEPALAI